jgi:hypothetical protein
MREFFAVLQRTKMAHPLRRCPMIMLDSQAVIALAAMISSISSLVWAMRRRR